MKINEQKSNTDDSNAALDFTSNPTSDFKNDHIKIQSTGKIRKIKVYHPKMIIVYRNDIRKKQMP